MQTVGPLISRIADVTAPALASFTGSDLATSADEIIRGMGEPLRVAVAGRVNAGKSTLVNSLLGQRAAPTDVSECTRLVTWYRFGESEAMRVVMRDGSNKRFALAPDGSLPAELDGVDLSDVSHLDVDLSIDDLRSMIIIDTPGLASSSEHLSAMTEQLLAVDRDSRDAIVQADALLLVVALGAHEDDVRIAEGFESHFRHVDRSAVNTVAVLTKIDHLGEAGPGRDARVGEIAAAVAERMPLSVSSMTPVNALVAQATQCGILTEADAAALRSIATLDDRERRLLMLSTDRFASAESSVPASARSRLLEVLDLSGIEEALELIGRGVTSATALGEAMRMSCGIVELLRVLREDIAPNADVIKATWALSALDMLAFAATEDGGGAQHRLRQALDDLSFDVSLNALRVHAALRQCNAGSVTLPEKLVQELRRLAVTPTVGDVLGGESGADEAAAAVEGVQRWRSFKNDGRSSPAARAVAEVVIEAYEMMWSVANAQSSAETIHVGQHTAS